jgi:hypothetical protein
MPFDKTTKEGWAHTLASGLGLTLQGLGFAKSGSAKYTKQEGGTEFRYLISLRYHRYSDAQY